MDIVQLLDTQSGGPNEKMVSFLDQKEFVVGTLTMYSLFCVFGISANGFLIGMIAYCRELRTWVNVFIVQLAIGDILVLSFCMPFTVLSAYYYQAWTFGEFICYAQKFGSCMGPTLSVLALAVLAYERYTAICRPLKSKPWNKSKVFGILVVIYSIAFARSIIRPTLGNVFKVTIDNNTQEISYSCSESGSLYLVIYNVTGVLLFYVLILVVTSVLYIKIALTLKETDRLCSFNAKVVKERVKVIRIMVVIMIAFAAFWAMSNALKLISATPYMTLLKKNAWYPVVVFTSRLCEYSNCVLNPIIFAVMSSRFQKATKKICCCSSGGLGANRDSVYVSGSTTVSSAS